MFHVEIISMDLNVNPYLKCIWKWFKKMLMKSNLKHPVMELMQVRFFYENEWLNWLKLWVLSYAETIITTVLPFGTIRKWFDFFLKMANSEVYILFWEKKFIIWLNVTQWRLFADLDFWVLTHNLSQITRSVFIEKSDHSYLWPL